MLEVVSQQVGGSGILDQIYAFLQDIYNYIMGIASPIDYFFRVLEFHGIPLVVAYLPAWSGSWDPHIQGHPLGDRSSHQTIIYIEDYYNIS